MEKTNMKTIYTPNQTAHIKISSHGEGYVMYCSFWPFSQPAFFAKFEKMFMVERVKTYTKRATPLGAHVYFQTTPENGASFLDEIEALFLDNYES